MDKNYDVISFNSRRPRVTNFADIIKTATMFINTTFKDSKKVKIVRNYVSKCNLFLYLLIQDISLFLDTSDFR